MTRQYKRTLTKAQKKTFRSLMWEFRRRPEKLSQAQKAALEALFERLPGLGVVYHLRWQLTEVFDTAMDAKEAKRRISQLRDIVKDDPDVDLSGFFKLYDEHREGILAYFEARKSSGPVEGINNKARVITKRAYGIKTAGSLWTRLVLDLNLAHKAICQTVRNVRALARALKTKLCGYYT